MIIWRLDDANDDGRFAEASVIGTWSEGVLCPGCRGSTERRLPPMILEWEPGSDVIGDFTGSLGEFAITERVAKTLRSRFRGFKTGPVEMVQNPRLKRPTRPNKRAKPRVWLPHTGPTLYELWITKWVHLDQRRSTAKLKCACDLCGRQNWTPEGVEYSEVRWDKVRLGGICIRHPRKLGMGFFVRRADLGGCDFFAIHGYGVPFCTDRAKRFIEAQGYTNIRFLEYGEAV